MLTTLKKLACVTLYVFGLTYGVYTFAQVVWISGPIFGNTNYYISADPVPSNGYQADDVSTESVCRVTLVGTNTVHVSNLLGLEKFPDIASDWWSIFDSRGGFSNTNDSDLGSLHYRAVTDPSFSKDSDEIQTLTAEHQDETNYFHLPDVGGVTVPAGAGGEALVLHLTMGSRSYMIDCDILNNADVAFACDFIKHGILAVLGCAVAFLIVRSWQTTMSSLQSATQAIGAGDSVLGNSANNLFAQINAALMTVIVSAACVVVTASVLSLVGVWVVHLFNSMPSGSVADIVWHFFNAMVPVVGIMGIAGFYLGWCSLSVAVEYMTRLLVRHTTA